MLKRALFAASALPLLAACADSSGPEDGGRVAVRFDAAAGSASRSVATDARFNHVPAPGAITLTGANGTLVIQDIRLIVSELELKRADDSCVGEEDDDECEEFEGGPFLVNLLDGTADEVVNARVPAGTYSELNFEVEDLDADEDDDDGERRAIQSVFTEMRQAYPNFPSDASMVVHGTFNGQPFTVYFEAEIEVEREFPSPFRVPDDGAVLVNLDPAAWFQGGGQVLNLAALNGRTIEFEAEFAHGVKIDHDDD